MNGHGVNWGAVILDLTLIMIIWIAVYAYFFGGLPLP